MNIITRIKNIPIAWKIFITLLIIDFIMVILHITYRVPFFDLDAEINLPTFYQSSKVLALGIFSLFILLNSHILKIKHGIHYILFLLTIALSSIYLAMDEMIQIHESIVDTLRVIFGYELVSAYESIFYNAGYSASNWLIFYIPVLILGTIFLGYLTLKVFDFIKKDIYLVVIAFVFIVNVIVLEFIGTSYMHSLETYQVIMIVEELSEMLAMTFLSLFMLNRYIDVFKLSKK